jgi:hypothetical protein
MRRLNGIGSDLRASFDAIVASHAMPPRFALRSGSRYEPRAGRNLIPVRPLNHQARRHFPSAVHAEREIDPL